MPISNRDFLRSQLLFLAVGLLALASIVAVALWLGGRATEISAETIAARDLKGAAVELQASVQRAESSQRGYLYTTNEVYLAPYDQAKLQAQRGLAALPQKLVGYPVLVAVTEKLKAAFDSKFAEMDESIALGRSRQTAAALDLILTNRGKALMDEANVYLNGIALAADNRLSALAGEQTANASWQRLVTVIGGLVAIAAAAAALVTIFRYAAELSAARDALSAVNAQLEDKVAARTADLARSNDEMRAAKERAELLMHEVNHRVANSLAMVSSLVGLQANQSQDGATRAALGETQSRIQAVALVHQQLYASGSVSEVALDDYLRTVLDQFQSAMGDGRRIALSYRLEPLSLKTDATLNLGVIAAEWVMNAAKYAYPGRSGEVRVSLAATDGGRALLAVEDDGIGRGDGPAKGTGLGSRIVKAMARSLNAEVEYIDRGPGLTARLAFPLTPAS